VSSADGDDEWEDYSDAGTDALKRWVDGMDENDESYYDSACDWRVLGDVSDYAEMTDRYPSNSRVPPNERSMERWRERD